MISSDRFEEAAFSQARRWEMPLLSVAETVEAAPPMPTAEELEAIEKAAYEEGFQRGYNEGRAEGRRSGEQAVRDEAQRLRKLVDHLAQPLADIDADVERTLVALTIEVARRLVDDQLRLDPTLTANAVRQAVASLSTPPREARVHLHPEDAALLAEHLPQPSDIAVWKLVPDRQLQRGDCRLITDSAQVDALLDTRQAGVARALLGDGE